MKYKINPFPAVRVNGKGGRFTTRATQYHNKMNELRLLIGDDKEKIIKALISGYYILKFHMPMPKSWSIKKNETKFLSPHRSTPDIDNLFKAFTDTVFYTKKDEKSKYNDSEIYSLNAVKIRDDEGYIEINITNNDGD